ncbi:MAG: DNA translocase FtsK 4TM domain-containing protein, partial [Allopontixanthobacter sediminis]
MASYQTRQRDPLLDHNTQVALERRGKELLGAALLVAGVLAAMIVGSYSTDDPSWMASTDAPAQNLLGRFGASIASPLFVIVGYASWGVAIALATWGVRFMTHRGEERALGRVIFVPIAIALGAVYASTLVPEAGWTHSFGLGGLFGDTVLGAVLGVVPVGATAGLKTMSLLFFVAVLAMSSFVLGFNGRELRAIARYLILSTLRAYDLLLRILGRSAVVSVRAAQAMQDKRHA